MRECFAAVPKSPLRGLPSRDVVAGCSGHTPAGENSGDTYCDCYRKTAADSRKGGVSRWVAERERRAELERQAVEKLADELLASIDTWLTVRDDHAAPASARLQAAERIVERILGKVGERLLVEKQERREVTVRYDVERLAGIVGSSRAWVRSKER
jgi:hypothetical protein